MKTSKTVTQEVIDKIIRLKKSYPELSNLALSERFSLSPSKICEIINAHKAKP
jgi:hypothetical protein